MVQSFGFFLIIPVQKAVADDGRVRFGIFADGYRIVDITLDGVDVIIFHGDDHTHMVGVTHKAEEYQITGGRGEQGRQPCFFLPVKR